MPAVSQKQRQALYAKFGTAWVHRHHFDVVDPTARVNRALAHHHNKRKLKKG